MGFDREKSKAALVEAADDFDVALKILSNKKVDVDEDGLKSLVLMGFAEAAAKNALLKSENNMDQAVLLLVNSAK